MRFAVIPLIISAALHVLGFVLVGFAYESLFLIFPAMLYCLLSVFLLRGNNWVAWLTLLCMIGGIAGTSIEFMGPNGAVARINWDHCIRRCSGRLTGPSIVAGSHGAQNRVSRDRSKISLERPLEGG